MIYSLNFLRSEKDLVCFGMVIILEENILRNKEIFFLVVDFRDIEGFGWNY